MALIELAPGIKTPRAFSDPVEEHLATRRSAGLFDFSFMACFEITGREALAFLQHLQTRDLQGLAPGRIAYTLLCRGDGSVLNDATIWCYGRERYWLFTGRRADRAHVESAACSFDVMVKDESGHYGIIALQGPRSASVLRRCAGNLSPLPYYGFARARILGHEAWVARIGYSAEKGYELLVEAGAAPALWNELQKAGAPLGLMQCGFAAADSLRIEAGYILFTRELAGPVTPYELGLGRLVSPYRGGYIGFSVLRRLRWRAPARRLVGLIPCLHCEEDSQALADLLGDKPWACAEPLASGTACLTSLCRSPLLGHPLALGYVGWEDRYPGSSVRLSRVCRARVARLPFYDPAKILPRS